MDANYSNIEFTDIVLIYGEALQNSYEAARLYAERFPNRHHPVPRTFLNVVQRLRDTGQVHPRHGAGGGPGQQLRNINRQEEILNIVTENPSSSTRSIARQVEPSSSSAWRTLKKNHLHPYHTQKVQELTVADYPLRLRFCQWSIQRVEENENFLQNVLWTDESTFTRNGMYNQHNEHIWAAENPHEIRTRHTQHRFSLNLWGGLLNGHLIGFHEFQHTLNGDNYLEFLQHDLEDMLDDIPVALRGRMYYMHDGAPAHFSRGVRQYLNAEFSNRWIGRLTDQDNGVRWPPRSPDLNPMDFYVWGHLKQLVYGAQGQMPENIEVLRQRIQDVSAEIDNEQRINGTLRSLVRRARLCIEQEGGHFEHLL